MDIIVLLIALALGLCAGLVVLVVALRQLGERHSAGQEAAVAAAVSAAVAEREATAEALHRDREATVQAAVTRANEVAQANFTAHMRHGTEQLDARMRLGTEQLDARMTQGNEQIASSAAAFEKRTAEMSAELRRMQKMVTDLQEKASGQQGAMIRGLEEAAKATSELRATTGGLREALASPKTRGQWGERMADDVLRAAGFKEGINYVKQRAIASGGIPDVTFLLPHDMHLHMDVKFPIDNYLRHLEAIEAGSADADQYRKQFRRDAKAKITELADRRYSEATNSVDYVLLFIPNESVYSFVHDNDPDILDTALGSKVVLCGPSTLFAVLAVIRQSMDNFLLERRGEEILDCLADFSSEWSKFGEQIDKVGRHLDTVHNSFEALRGTRSNVMQKKLRRIDELQSGRDQSASISEPADPELMVADLPRPILREVSA